MYMRTLTTQNIACNIASETASNLPKTDVRTPVLRWVSVLRRAGALISMAAVVVCGIGCGSHDSVPQDAASGAPVDAEAGNAAQGTFEHPAPGAMVPSPPEPITLESAWAWRDIWIPFKDLEVCKFQAFGLKEPADTSAGKEFTVDNLDNHVLFTFEKSAFEAGQCTGMRVQLPNSKNAALWWAREDDIKPNEYPFSPERFKPLKQAQSCSIKRSRPK